MLDDALSAPLAALKTLAGPDGWSDDPDHVAQDLVPAAVLVGIVTNAEPGVLLTRRTASLRKHSGQVSFPGGRIDPEDASPEAAALREAHEEIGLESRFVEILGRLGNHITGLALISPGFTTTLSPDEVDAVFELPLPVVMDPAAPERRQAELAGRTRHYWVWPHPEHFVWGATAAILVQLAQRLGNPPAD